MQVNFLKLVIILFLIISISGCSEVHLRADSGTESIIVIRDFFYYILWGLCGVFILIGIIAYAAGSFDDQHSENKSTGCGCLLAFCFIAFLLWGFLGGTVPHSKFKTDPKLVAAAQRYQEEQEMSNLGLDKKEYEQRKQLGVDRYNLKAQIKKAKINLASFKQDRDEKVLPLKQNYSKMYDQYHTQLAQQLPETGIQTHEELLKSCGQYLELCLSLNRIAKLQYYIGKLDNKLKQIEVNVIKLDDNVWNMERNFEVSQIFSNEELENVEQLIEETKGKIDSQVPPPERQDIAGLEEQIFNNILRS